MIIAAPIEAPDQSESRFFSHYDPKTVEWFNVDPLMNLFA